MLALQKNGRLDDIDRSIFTRDEEKVALIDADSMLYYTLGQETYEDAILKLDTDMFNLLNALGVNRYIAFTTPKTHFRKRVAKTKPYKGNRKGKKTPPIFYAVSAYAREAWNFQGVLGLEADDCVMIYQEMLRRQGIESIICSPDKDVIRQVAGKHYNYQRKEKKVVGWVTTKPEDAWEFLWTQAATGDSVDQIPGIHGVGPKTMEKTFLTVRPQDYPLRVMKMYIEKKTEGESVKNAIDRFKETLDLVYMLRTPEEAAKAGVEIPEIEPIQVESLLEYSDGN